MSFTKQKIQVLVNGNPYTVEIGDLNEAPIVVTVNGQDYSVDIQSDAWQEIQPGGRSASSPQASRPRTTPPSSSRDAAVPASASAPAPGSGGAVTAPMPGTIIQVFVKQGDRVEVGQDLCSLEAMKMKNSIHASISGVVTGVHVQEGQTVAYGAVLFTFE